MGAGRKTQTVDVDTKAFGQQDFEGRQRNLGPSQLKGAIFGEAALWFSRSALLLLTPPGADSCGQAATMRR